MSDSPSELNEWIQIRLHWAHQSGSIALLSRGSILCDEIESRKDHEWLGYCLMFTEPIESLLLMLRL